MNLIIAAGTDKGLQRQINEDSLLARQLRIEGHHVAVAIVSDGMGGEVRGDIASASVVKSFENWIDSQLPILIRENATRDRLRISWKRWLDYVNEKLNTYGRMRGVTVGATATVILIIDDVYFIMNVGDSRIYRITADQARQITEDQTMTALAVRRGDMTELEAEHDDRQGILAQAVGMNESCIQDLYAGRIVGDTVFLLCSDGFRHKVTTQEIEDAFRPNQFLNKMQMKKQIENLINLNRSRGEMDNITAVLIKAY